ncbi:MAG TPA: GNAT family N-acetyltransferase [Pyrinomonadaceae bacterium]|nr:GNAT family N-acetyltransferase [Pyrinomonadaceae bacterium]
MSEIKIRQANLEDAEKLTDLAYKTFWDAFHDHPKNAPEDLADYMRKAFNLEQTRRELAEENSIFLIAEIENEPVGYAKVMIGTREPEITGENPIELNRLYSKQEFLGKGIGARLMEECFRIAQKFNCDVMWLGVWEFNPRAQAFYRKYGFREVGKHVFQLGSDAQIDLLMQKDLG